MVQAMKTVDVANFCLHKRVAKRAGDTHWFRCNAKLNSSTQLTCQHKAKLLRAERNYLLMWLQCDDRGHFLPNLVPTCGQ